MIRLQGILAAAALVFAGLCAAQQPAQQPTPATLKWDIRSQAIDAALNEFARQSGLQVILQTKEVSGITSKPLVGSFTTQAALSRLLSDTGLSFEYLNDRTVAVRSKSAAASGTASQTRNYSPGVAMNVAQVVPPLEPQRTVAQAAKDEPVDPTDPNAAQEVIVEGRRIDGLNNKGLLQSGENSALYHDVITAEDIERFGISSVEELFRLIPQTSSASTSLQVPSGDIRITGGLVPRPSTIGLRGFSSTQTVVLVNGRALPRSGTNSGADISRIPIAAIERVEVLPYSGSAIYGAGALGGAINIILRKGYSGHDLNTYVSTSTEGGGSEYRVTYLGGFNFNESRTTLTTTASYQHRDELRGGDRDYLDEALRRYGPGSTAVDQQGTRLFESLILPAFAGAPGTVLIGNPPSATLNSLGIPGAPTARYAAIPTGLTGLQTAGLTPASFTATANTANLEPRFARSVLYSPIDSYSVNAQLEHAFIPDRLEAYGEFTLGYNRRNYSAPQNFLIQLDANDPLNPFRTNVTPNFVGRPITIFMDTPDLPDASNIFEDESARAVMGLKGRFSSSWEWSADGVVDYAHSSVNSDNPITNLLDLTRLVPSGNPPGAAPAATRRAIYPIFADHTAYPLSSGDVDNYFGSTRYSTSKSMQWEGNARVLGTVFKLPAGPLQTSALGKYQYWDFTSGQTLGESAGATQLISGGDFDPDGSSTPVRRKVLQGAVEISIPIISREWRPIPIESFEIQASYSREHDVSSSVADDEPFENKQSASTGVVAGRLQLTKDIAFRGSYSEGFYPPDWSAVGLPITTQMLPGFFVDPARGNTRQFMTQGAPIMTILQGGNPGLQPETAKSDNFGLILTPRFAPGFSMNVDFWRIEKVDAIVFSSFVDIIANPAAYGFLITRTAPTAQDTAQGWLGFITQVDARAFNASVTRTEGTDVKIRYSMDMARMGSIEATVGGSFVNNFQLLATPNSPEINTAGGSGPIRRRFNSFVTWNYHDWSTTVTGRYTGSRATLTTAPSESYPGAFPIDGSRLPASMQWDLQLAYELPYDKAGSKSWMAGTRLTLGVLNVLNEEPTFVSAADAGFYNGAQDPRQRVVYLQVKKSF